MSNMMNMYSMADGGTHASQASHTRGDPSCTPWTVKACVARLAASRVGSATVGAAAGSRRDVRDATWALGCNVAGDAEAGCAPSCAALGAGSEVEPGTFGRGSSSDKQIRMRCLESGGPRDGLVTSTWLGCSNCCCSSPAALPCMHAQSAAGENHFCATGAAAAIWRWGTVQASQPHGRGA